MKPISPQSIRDLTTELQSLGLRLSDPALGVAARRGGAGPSDHKAVTIGDRTLMVPVHTIAAWSSPFVAAPAEEGGANVLMRDGIAVARIAFPKTPRFYALQTLDGIPYPKIAVLHGADVLATTVLQTCVRYESRRRACKFCSIGQSLAAGRTIARKTPEQLAEVARAAVLLDGVKHMVMTTGTPGTPDRGAEVLCESAFAVKAAVELPIQAQCEPPEGDEWFPRMKAAGIDALGMHIEVISPALRRDLMPGKATVPLERYYDAFRSAVPVFGRGQVSTYILAGLGDTRETILATCAQLVALGVYPFVVPFVPISGTPLEDHPAPDPAFMRELLQSVGTMLKQANLRSSDMKAGCGKCGACSSLAAYET